jgi:hypothetical protein
MAFLLALFLRHFFFWLSFYGWVATSAWRAILFKALHFSRRQRFDQGHPGLERAEGVHFAGDTSTNFLASISSTEMNKDCFSSSVINDIVE